MALHIPCAAMALLAFGAVAQAAPIEYSFELTITELRTGGRVDPYYASFHLGQKLYGNLTYDPSAPIDGVFGYHNTTRLAVTIGDTLMTTRFGYLPDPSGTYIRLTDGAEGGMDTFYMFEEVPLVSGGYLGNYQAEQFYISLNDYDGTAITGTSPVPIDFTLFDGGRWNFWSWGDERLYSSLLMDGSVGAIRPVPTPNPLILGAFAAVAILFRGLRKRTNWPSEPEEGVPPHPCATPSPHSSYLNPSTNRRPSTSNSARLVSVVPLNPE